MADKQFDLSPELKKLYLERAKRRQELRNEFLKTKHNPLSTHGVVSPTFNYFSYYVINLTSL